ncbi:hypothetical protein K490DRAFT_35524 [Saccharata proteae CBS 121410]|uniref:Cytochrome p450 protein n=1 Tax=Saccharata proteae CBS 121410 TaxID=1314787 RepID=A0A9P4LX99_9PEZI|nr:hypothetical protein K490DRAFT_35524 [Saccharata proteae CBS 121410]
MDSTTVQQTAFDGSVYLGPWINWSHGYVKGATITLTRRDGGLMIAFVALFVGIAGTCLWRITCFALHHILSSETAEDGLYHQRQAILRNAATGTNGLCGLLQLGWFWRGKARRSYRRILPLIGLTVFLVSAFAVAGIFSSQVSTSVGTEVLLTSPGCGYFDLSVDQNLTQLDAAYLPYIVLLKSLSSSYAQECYTDSGKNDIAACEVYVKQNIPFTTSFNASCPFSPEMCADDIPVIQIDSGHINSHEDLGINAAPKDRFTYRQITTCAPVKTDGFTTVLNGSDGSLRSQYEDYQYGPSYLAAPNTYEYTTWYDSSQFEPIPQLQRDDADTLLFLLSPNDVLFLAKVDDPWYSAHQSYNATISGGIAGSEPAWYRDKPVSILGCTTQYQYCNPNVAEATGCTPLTGIFAAKNITNDAGFWGTELQRTAVHNFGYNNWYLSGAINTVVYNLGISALSARATMGGGLQSPLPDNQWQLEVQHWYQILMANLQRMMIEAAVGPADAKLDVWMVKPSTREGRTLCASQKVKSTSYTSFSTLSLILVFVLGGLIIAVSYTLEVLTSFVSRRLRLGLYQRVEWTANETLQLQRLAHEELGAGNWETRTRGVPVTAFGERLAVLDLSWPEHPRLRCGQGEGMGVAGKEKETAVVRSDEISSPTATTVTMTTSQGSERSGSVGGRSGSGSSDDGDAIAPTAE